MPIISRFFGIAIMMYWKDHNPPHFHAKYNGDEVLILIDGKILEGKFPPRALQLVLEWLKMHKVELLENWRRVQNEQPLLKIEPLK